MYITRTNSTNTLLKELLADNQWSAAERFIRAGYQTAGRGQAGNSWESEADRNLLCSVLIDPQKVKDKRPFYLNVAVSVAVHRMVNSQFSILNSPLAIKWPNDIYYGDKKIAGILIENMIIGSELKYAIAGIGLNVNQTTFVSDAPNPVSMKQITGREFNLDELMTRLLEEIDAAMSEDAWAYYKAHLYRREGLWLFVEREVSILPTMNVPKDDALSNKAFLARIKDITEQGEIVLQDEQGAERKYHFKQIRYII